MLKRTGFCLKPSRKNVSTSAILLIITATLSSCSLISDLAPVKEDTSQVRDWLSVPIFYATTRKRAATKAIDFLEKRAEHGLQFGVKNVAVPAPAPGIISDETAKKLGFRFIHLQAPLPNGKRPELAAAANAVQDRELKPAEVVTEFHKYRTQTTSPRVIIFVHGCCATFQASLERAAKISAYMQTPLVIFDWDSPKGFSKYLENETLAEQSYDDFYEFLNAVEKTIPAGETTLLSHSMGAHFVDRALVRRSERARFNVPFNRYREVVYSQPDIDAKSYLRHNQDVAGQAELTRIFFNAKDGRLNASRTAHGDFPRLGRPAEVLPYLAKVSGQEMIDITSCAAGHEILFPIVAAYSRGEKLADFGYVSRKPGLENLLEIKRLKPFVN